MKWDKTNKDKLFLLLESKFIICDEWVPRGDFFKTFGIERVKKAKEESFYLAPERTGFWVDSEHRRARSRSHIIIDDPLWGKNGGIGLKIPKDIAEKFLVLGVP